MTWPHMLWVVVLYRCSECDRPAGDYHLPDCPLYPHKVAP